MEQGPARGRQLVAGLQRAERELLANAVANFFDVRRAWMRVKEIAAGVAPGIGPLLRTTRASCLRPAGKGALTCPPWPSLLNGSSIDGKRKMGLTEEQLAFQDTVRRIRKRRSPPKWRRNRSFPREIVDLFGNVGHATLVPERYGGPEAHLTMVCIAREEIARYSPSCVDLPGSTRSSCPASLRLETAKKYP